MQDRLIKLLWNRTLLRVNFSIKMGHTKELGIEFADPDNYPTVFELRDILSQYLSFPCVVLFKLDNEKEYRNDQRFYGNEKVVELRILFSTHSTIEQIQDVAILVRDDLNTNISKKWK